MPLSLWGLDDARKTFNNRLDNTGSAAWKSIRGKPVADQGGPPPPANPSRPPPPPRTSTTTSPSGLEPPPRKDFAPPPRKVSSALDVSPVARTKSPSYVDAKSKKPPPPPLPSRDPSGTPPLPRRSTSSAVSTESDGSLGVRPSDMFVRAPSLPGALQRRESQDEVTNELAERLARMRMKHSEMEEGSTPSVPSAGTGKRVPPKATASNPIVTTGPPPIAKSTKPVVTPKPSLPPRTTPIPPTISSLKPPQQPLKRPPPLPYKPSSLHRAILPEFLYPPPEAQPCHGLQTFNRLFPTPTWEMEQASLIVLDTLYPSDSTYTFRPKTLDGPVSLIMREMPGNAHAENSSVTIGSGGRREIKWRSNLVFSVGNLTNVANGRRDGAFVDEVRGVIVHELTHSWQWSCTETPFGLTEGIADFVRLRANLAPPHWDKSPKGKQWDAGYATTAYFLDYVDREVYPGFVACVNEWLGQEGQRDGTYDEERLFAEVMPGWGWEVLWDQWCENCR